MDAVYVLLYTQYLLTLKGQFKLIETVQPAVDCSTHVSLSIWGGGSSEALLHALFFYYSFAKLDWWFSQAGC